MKLLKLLRNILLGPPITCERILVSVDRLEEVPPRSIIVDPTERTPRGMVEALTFGSDWEFFEYLASRMNNDRIHSPPGSRLRSLSQFLFSRKTFNRVFAPVLGDLVTEYIEALAQGDHVRAYWVYGRGIASFWITFAVHVSTSALVRVVRAFLAG